VIKKVLKIKALKSDQKLVHNGRTRVDTNLLSCESPRRELISPLLCFSSGSERGERELKQILSCESPRHLIENTINKENQTSTQRGERSILKYLLSCESPRHVKNDQNKTHQIKNKNEGRTTTHTSVLPIMCY